MHYCYHFFVKKIKLKLKSKRNSFVFVQKRFTWSQTLLITPFETSVIGIVIRIPYDGIAFRVERAQQQYLCFRSLRFLPVDVGDVRLIHAENEIEPVEVFFDQLFCRMAELYAVVSEHAHRPVVRRRAHVPPAGASALDVPLVRHAVLPGHLIEHGLGHRGSTNVTQTDEQNATHVAHCWTTDIPTERFIDRRQCSGGFDPKTTVRFDLISNDRNGKWSNKPVMIAIVKLRRLGRLLTSAVK